VATIFSPVLGKEASVDKSLRSMIF